jgi:transcriptional regulator with XRE-family HTH domain
VPFEVNRSATSWEPPVDADLTPTIGKRLREMRKMRGLTVREQAGLLQVSPSTLSELERGIAGISLQRLQGVAHSLGVSVSDLLTSDEPPTAETPRLEIIRPADLGAASIRRGHGVHYTLVGAHGEHTLQPYRIMFDAGAGYADDPIAHPGEEFVYVLFGEVHLHLGQEEHLLTTGACARFDSGVAHAFSNASTSDVAGLIGAGTPPW